MGKIISGQISLPDTNQPYNNANRGIVGQGKIKNVPQCTGTKVTLKRGNS
jgi:hypothetical protein